MNDRPGARLERRRYARTNPKGTSVIRSDSYALRGRITNLGEGGMFVATRAGVPEPLLGSAVDIELRLDAGFAQWVQGTGRIVRIDPGGVAVAFDAVSVELRHMIDDLTTASRARVRILAVVLIDAHAERRSAMAAGFRGVGCGVIEAATPLEAIVRLGESSFEPDVIAIADSHPDASAEEMRSFVQRNHPNAKLVTIGDDALEPDGIAHWLSSADPETDLSERVREILVRPRPVTRS
jgi:methylmalonyl-CoA mutase cobalamin-binding subunit